MDTPLQPALALVPPFNNQFLFSDHYLDSLLPQEPRWDAALPEAQAFANFLSELYTREKKQLPHYNEAQLEQNWLRKIFAQLGHVFEIQASVPGLDAHISRPDYVFFGADAERQAATREQKTHEYAQHALAVGEVKAWNVPLGKKLKGGGPSFDAQNPSWQIAQYVSAMGLTWGILSNGREWRLVQKDSSGRLAIYYQVDLVELLARGDASAFRYFTLFFSQAAFRPDAQGRVFLDDALRESTAYARALEQDLRVNVYRALERLMQGFLDLPANHLDEKNLREIYDNSLYLLYRLLFILYGESRGLLPLQNDRYRANYALDTLKREIAELKHKPAQRTTNYWGRLKNLFQIINGDDAELNRELGVPRYNGGLFSPILHPFLENNAVGDRALVEAIDLLSRRNGEFVDYRTLGVRQLGSIYEGLLESQPRYAAQNMIAVREGKTTKWIAEHDAPTHAQIQERRTAQEIFLENDRGERKATGSYYTPEYIVQYIVKNTLAPLVADARTHIESRGDGRQRGLSLADEVLKLRVLDPAMGSGHFLVDAMEFLALELANDPHLQEEIPGDEDLLYWKRRVVERCIYGVDKNPLAVELAKLSLWLATVAADQPLSFLDHHLKHGDSLIGARVKDLGNAPPILLTKKQLAQQQAGQINLFEYRLAQQLPIVLGKILEITETASDTYERVQTKEVVNEALEKLQAPFEQVANLWTSAYFGNQFTLSEYDDALNSISTPEKLSALPALQRAQELARERDFFHWALAFPEVFYDANGHSLGERAGFDAVIGNPPYVRVRTLKEANDASVKFLEEDSNYKSAVHVWDLYMLFAEQALRLARIGGNCCFIVPIQVLHQPNALALRKLLVENGQVRQIVDLGKLEIFESAIVKTCILHYSPSLTRNVDSMFIRVPTDEDLYSTPSVEIDYTEILESPDHSFKPDLLEAKPLLNRIETGTIPLNKEFYVTFGLRSSARKKGEGDKSRLILAKANTKRAKPYIEGREIGRYETNWGLRYIDYAPEKMYSPRTPELFEQPKIVSQTMLSTKRLVATYDPDFKYVEQSLLCIVPLDASNQEHSLLYILAILNSTLASFYFARRIIGDSLGGGLVHATPGSQEKIPICKIYFTTAANERARLAAELARMYEQGFAENDMRDILERVAQHLAASPAQNDVVHDFLAQLAAQMLETNKQKQNVTRAFWDDLDGVSDAATFKALQKGKQEASLLNASDVFEPFLRAESHATRSLDESLAWNEDAFKAFAKTLASKIKNLSELVSVYRKHNARYSEISARLKFTDALIDEIVYRLYGLTEQERAVVAGG